MRRPRRNRLIRNLGLAAIVGSTLLRPPFVLPGNAAAVDLVLAAIIVIGWRGVARRQSDAGRLLRRLAPWLYLYLLGQIIGLIGVGIQGWAVFGIARNLLPIFVFVALIALLEGRPRDQQALVVGYVATGVFVALTVFALGGSRGRGLFDNPNYAGHFLACAVLLTPYLRLQLVARAAIVGVLSAGIYRTGSFAAALIVLTAATAGAWSLIYRYPRSVRGVLRLGLALGMAFAAWVGWSQFDGARVDAGSGVSSERFNRSSQTRLQLWTGALELYGHHPFGVGTDGIRNRNFELLEDIGEAHSDPLDTLVAGGPLAVIGLVGIVTVLWRRSPRGSRLRVALTALIVSSMFRQTWNFRHMWLFLAVALAIELSAAGQRGLRSAQLAQRVE